MKKQYILTIIIFLISINLSFSQSIYVDNAYNFSKNDYGGTARFIGMGGAFGALGGDFSSIAINPAGLGVYRNSEFVFSPGMSYAANDANYIGNSVNESSYVVNVNNAGFVASYDLDESDTRWVNFNFGVGFNRTTNLNDNVRYEGINDNSYMEVFVDYANSTAAVPSDLDGMYELLLYNAGVIRLDTNLNEFYSHITDEVINDPANFEIFQQKVIENDGSINEFSFSFGGNYAHKLYVGFSIGIVWLNYDQFISHYEYETDNLDIYETNGFDFREYSKTNGTGYNFKLGFIYRPLDFLRIGGAFHIPTFFDLEQEFNNRAVGYFESEPTRSYGSYVEVYEYELITPIRLIGSVGFQIGKFALMDLDYEYVDYSTMDLDDSYHSQGVNDDNAYINNNFEKVHNIRAGAELRYGPLYFRGGGRYSTSPFKETDALNPDYDKITLAGGLGYREKHFFVDFAFSQTSSSYELMAYEYQYNNAIANIDNKTRNFVLSFGFKF